MADYTVQSHYFLNNLPENLYTIFCPNNEKIMENITYKGSKISVDIDLF